jgi:hypothetical protein
VPQRVAVLAVERRPVARRHAAAGARDLNGRGEASRWVGALGEEELELVRDAAVGGGGHDGVGAWGSLVEGGGDFRSLHPKGKQWGACWAVYSGLRLDRARSLLSIGLGRDRTSLAGLLRQLQPLPFKCICGLGRYLGSRQLFFCNLAILFYFHKYVFLSFILKNKSMDRR